MRWFWALPLAPLLLCGVMCVGGAVVAFVVGKKAADERRADNASAADRPIETRHGKDG